MSWLNVFVECKDVTEYPRLELPGTEYMPLNREVYYIVY